MHTAHDIHLLSGSTTGPHDVEVIDSSDEELTISDLRKELKAMKKKLERRDTEGRAYGDYYKQKEKHPQKFTGERNGVEYRVWSREVKLYSQQVNHRIKPILNWADRVSTKEMSREKYEAEKFGLQYDGVNQAVEDIILQHVGGVALTLVQTEDDGNGLKMWCKIRERHDRNKPEEIRALMGKISRPKQAGSVTAMAAALDELERDIQRFEVLAEKECMEELKVEAVCQICPSDLKKEMHIHGALGSTATYDDAKRILFYIARATEADVREKAGSGRRINSIEEEEQGKEWTTEEAVEEELYAVGGTTKGKGNQKGGTKGSQNKGKGKGNPTHSGPVTCFACGKLGHMARECWSTACWTCQGLGTHLSDCPRARQTPQEKGGKGTSKGKSKGKGGKAGKSKGKGHREPSQPLWSYSEGWETSEWGPGGPWKEDEGWPGQERVHIDALLDEGDAGLYSYATARVGENGEASKGKVMFRTIIDSGAAENVLPEDHCLVRDSTIRTSPKKGTVYTGATETKRQTEGR